MIARFFRKLIGDYCDIHDIAFDSDLCPQCVRARIVKMETVDDRKEWHKAEGQWPLNRED